MIFFVTGNTNSLEHGEAYYAYALRPGEGRRD